VPPKPRISLLEVFQEHPNGGGLDLDVAHTAGEFAEGGGRLGCRLVPFSPPQHCWATQNSTLR
jgi:hypothetical protein